MTPAPAPERGFQNFSASTLELAIFLLNMAPTPAPFDLNFAGSGSAPN